MTGKASADLERTPTLGERYARFGVPFVEEAHDAVILELEETSGYSNVRRGFLAYAGIVSSVEEGTSTPVCVDPDQARARRLAEPYPDLVIMCRLQVPAGMAIRAAEREHHLPHVPILVAGGRPLEELANYARAVDGDAVLQMHGAGEYSSEFGSALIEAVLRLCWPTGFARACAELGGDASTRAWREGSASMLDFAARPGSDGGTDAERIKAMRVELGSRIYDAVTARWMNNAHLGSDLPDDERARFMGEALAWKRKLDELATEGTVRGLLTPQEAAWVRGDFEVPATIVSLVMTGRPAPHRFSNTTDGNWLEEAFTPEGWVPVRILPPPASSDPNDLIKYLVLGKGRPGQN